MSGRVGDLSPKQEDGLKEFRKNVADVLEAHHDDHFLLKWLRARHWNLKKAEEMLRASLKYKKQMNVVELCKTWKDPEIIDKYFVGGISGFDKEGSPVWCEPFGSLDAKGIIYSTKTSDLIKNKIVVSENMETLMEEQSKKLGRRVDSVVVVFDLEHVNWHHVWKPFVDVYGQILSLFEANYPEALKKCFVTRAPRLFAVGYNMMKHFLCEDTRNKVVVLGNNFESELLKYIDADQLPAHFGGTLRDPDGNPRYTTKIRYGGKIPESYYLKDKDLNTDAMQTATVGRGSTHDLEYTVEVPGSVISWEFLSEGSDIGFGIFRSNGCKNGLVTVLPSTRYKSNIVIEDGEIIVDDPGIYVVRFDNSYSWVKSKKIKYAIQVLLPDKEVEAQIQECTKMEECT